MGERGHIGDEWHAQDESIFSNAVSFESYSPVNRRVLRWVFSAQFNVRQRLTLFKLCRVIVRQCQAADVTVSSAAVPPPTAMKTNDKQVDDIQVFHSHTTPSYAEPGLRCMYRRGIMNN